MTETRARLVAGAHRTWPGSTGAQQLVTVCGLARARFAAGHLRPERRGRAREPAGGRDRPVVVRACWCAVTVASSGRPRSTRDPYGDTARPAVGAPPRRRSAKNGFYVFRDTGHDFSNIADTSVHVPAAARRRHVDEDVPGWLRARSARRWLARPWPIDWPRAPCLHYAGRLAQVSCAHTQPTKHRSRPESCPATIRYTMPSPSPQLEARLCVSPSLAHAGRAVYPSVPQFFLPKAAGWPRVCTAPC